MSWNVHASVFRVPWVAQCGEKTGISCSTVVESTIIKILMTMPILFIVSETKHRWYGHAGLAVVVLGSET
jgi:hypothetical protein